SYAASLAHTRSPRRAQRCCGRTMLVLQRVDPCAASADGDAAASTCGDLYTAYLDIEAHGGEDFPVIMPRDPTVHGFTPDGRMTIDDGHGGLSEQAAGDVLVSVAADAGSLHDATRLSYRSATFVRASTTVRGAQTFQDVVNLSVFSTPSYLDGDKKAYE